MWTDSPLLRDAGAAVLTGVAMAAVLCFGKEVANPRAAGPETLQETGAHNCRISVFPDVAFVQVTVIGLGLVKDEGVVNSMTRHGNYRFHRISAVRKQSIWFMCYFNIFGFVEKSWTMVAAFGVISLVAAVVESLPMSTRLDDNVTVPVALVLFGALVFYSIGARNLCCISSEDRRSISATVGMVFAGSSSSS